MATTEEKESLVKLLEGAGIAECGPTEYAAYPAAILLHQSDLCRAIEAVLSAGVYLPTVKWHGKRPVIVLANRQ
jgi:hypothetical protein